MTLNAAESLKDIWSSIFRRKGGNGAYTRLFDSLESENQVALLTAAGLRQTELPVIGSVQDQNNWLILTTERLVWSTAGKHNELAVEAIRDATADYRQLQRNQRSKLEMQQLQVVTMAGGEYSIELEPGQPLSGTWNVLMNLGARNRR
jgi:hypothetical protein